MIELLAVMVIMALMMTISIAAFNGLTRSVGMRGSALNVKTSIDLTRQRAITYREHTCFTFANTPSPERGYYIVTNIADGIIGQTNFLAQGIVFANSNLPQTVTYNYDGTCANVGIQDIQIMLMEIGAGTMGLTSIVEVLPITGRARIIQ